MIDRFERIARRSPAPVSASTPSEGTTHPFDERNIHPDVSKVSLKLFNDGHYSQATFEAFKLVDKRVSTVSGVKDSGYKLMMSAFNEANPRISLTDNLTPSEIDEQLGYKFVFAGAMSAIRNPRGHEILADPIDLCLDHLSLASVLYRRLEARKAP